MAAPTPVAAVEYLRVSRQRGRMMYPSRRRTILDARLRRMWDLLTADERAYVTATWRDPR